MEDLEDAWDFVKKEQLESEDEDDEMNPEQKEFKELTAEDMVKANNALQAHMLIIAELKRKIEHELYMAEAAATAGWGAVSVLENKMFTNVSGATDAKKEMKMRWQYCEFIKETGMTLKMCVPLPPTPRCRGRGGAGRGRGWAGPSQRPDCPVVTTRVF